MFSQNGWKAIVSGAESTGQDHRGCPGPLAFIARVMGDIKALEKKRDMTYLVPQDNHSDYCVKRLVWALAGIQLHDRFLQI